MIIKITTMVILCHKFGSIFFFFGFQNDLTREKGNICLNQRETPYTILRVMCKSVFTIIATFLLQKGKGLKGTMLMKLVPKKILKISSKMP